MGSNGVIGAPRESPIEPRFHVFGPDRVNRRVLHAGNRLVHQRRIVVAVPAKDGDVAAKAGMACIDVLGFLGGAPKIRAGRWYEAEVRALFDEPARARGIVFARVRTGPSVTYAFHFDVGQERPVVPFGS